MLSVLIVDDADGIREILGDALERKGLKILRASTGIGAVKLYKQERPNFVFLDIKLPDLNGMNVYEQMRKIDQHPRIYFITGKDNEMFRQKAQDLGASGYLVKPVRFEDLLAILGIEPT